MVGLVFTVLAAFFGSKQIAFKLGQLAGATQRVAIDDIRRVALGVAMLLGLHVQHQLRKRTVQARDLPLHHSKTGASELDAHLEIQAQGCADIHMVFDRKVHTARRAPAAHFDVVVLIGAHRHRCMRQIGNRQQQSLQFCLNGFQPHGRSIQLALDGTNLRHDGVGGFALGFELADQLARRIAFGLQFFSAHLDGLALGLQRLECCHVQKLLRIFTRLQASHN